MAIHYTCTVVEETLFVQASGFDESAEEVAAYGMAIIRACLEHRIRRVLCDESELEYRLGMFDTYEAATLLATNIPSLGKAAIVCNPQFIADARLWEHVVRRRSLMVRVFISAEKAMHWLRDAPA